MTLAFSKLALMLPMALARATFSDGKQKLLLVVQVHVYPLFVTSNRQPL